VEHLRLFPRPQPPRAGPTICFCACHGDEFTEPPINGIVTPGVSRQDARSAVMACPECLRYHCVALSGRPPELDLPLSGHRYSPPPLVAVPQADGGEGGEA
jgi:hypothetical protein